MRRFCLQNVESILGDTKKDLPKRTGPFHYIRVLIYSSTAAWASVLPHLFPPVAVPVDAQPLMLGRCTSAVGQDGVWTSGVGCRSGIDGNVSDASIFADMQGHGAPGVELAVAVAVGEACGGVGDKLQHQNRAHRPTFHPEHMRR